MREFAEIIIGNHIYICLLGLSFVLMNKVFANKITPQLRFFLWLLIIVRALTFYSVPSRLNVINVVENGIDLIKANYVGEYYDDETLDSAESIIESNSEPILRGDSSILPDDNQKIIDNTTKTSVDDIIITGDSSVKVNKTIGNQETDIENSGGIDTDNTGRFQYMSIHEAFELIMATIMNWLPNWLIGLYLFVALIFILFPLVAYYTLKEELKSYSREAKDSELSRLALKISQRVNLNREFSVICDEGIKRPGVVGLIKPILLLPTWVRIMDTDELEMILLHEVQHIKLHHMLFIYLTWFVKGIYWCNPFMWYAHEHMKYVAELWCDYEIKKELTPDERRAYGHLMIDMQTHPKLDLRYIEVVGFSNADKGLKQRILELTRNKYSKVVSLVFSLIVVVLVLMLFTSNPYQSVSQVPTNPYYNQTVLLDQTSIVINDDISLIFYQTRADDEGTTIYGQWIFGDSFLDKMSNDYGIDIKNMDLYASAQFMVPGSQYAQKRREYYWNEYEDVFNESDDNRSFMIHVNDLDYNPDTDGPIHMVLNEIVVYKTFDTQNYAVTNPGGLAGGDPLLIEIEGSQSNGSINIEPWGEIEFEHSLDNQVLNFNYRIMANDYRVIPSITFKYYSKLEKTYVPSGGDSGSTEDGSYNSSLDYYGSIYETISEEVESGIRDGSILVDLYLDYLEFYIYENDGKDSQSIRILTD